MEVVKHGNLAHNTVRQFECKVCKAVVRASLSEGGPSVDGEHVMMQCPECFHRNHIAIHRWHEGHVHQIITL